MPFSKIMPLLSVLSRDPLVRAALVAASGGTLSVAGARSWERLLWLIRERPITGVVVDSAALPKGCDQAAAVGALRRRFPSLGTVLIARPDIAPIELFRLGRAGISDLVLIPLDDLERGLARGIARAGVRSTASLVAGAISGRLPFVEQGCVRLALDGVQLGWSADDFAARVGWTRAHLSVRLKARGLPSAGHLLTWAKLLHAARWLDDPGRSAESISRQLEYSSGAAFRRALRNYVGGTPTSVREGGALRHVMDRFLDVSGLGGSLGAERFVA